MECEGKGCCWSPKDVSMIQCTVVCEQDIVGECFIIIVLCTCTLFLLQHTCYRESHGAFTEVRWGFVLARLVAVSIMS